MSTTTRSRALRLIDEAQMRGASPSAMPSRLTDQTRYPEGDPPRPARLRGGHPVPFASHDDTTHWHVRAVDDGARIAEFPTTSRRQGSHEAADWQCSWARPTCAWQLAFRQCFGNASGQRRAARRTDLGLCAGAPDPCRLHPARAGRECVAARGGRDGDLGRRPAPRILMIAAPSLRASAPIWCGCGSMGEMPGWCAPSGGRAIGV